MTPTTIEAQKAVETPPNGLVKVMPSSGDSMLSMIERVLTTPDFDMAKLQHLLELRERYEANEARKAFDHAFAAFKSESVHITKNMSVSDGPLKGKKYADLFAVVSATTAALSKHGLSSFWRLTKDEPAWIEVTCILRHELGHCETVSMGGPPDTGGAKNAIQSRASTKSYLERYTFLAITGQAASNGDSDGNGGESGKRFEELSERLEWIANCRNETELFNVSNQAYKDAKAAGDMGAMKTIIAAKDRKRGDLRANNRAS